VIVAFLRKEGWQAFVTDFCFCLGCESLQVIKRFCEKRNPFSSNLWYEIMCLNSHFSLTARRQVALLFATRDSVFRNRAGRHQAKPFRNYRFQSCNTHGPIELAGFGCQFTGLICPKYWVYGIKQFLSADGNPKS